MNIVTIGVIAAAFWYLFLRKSVAPPPGAGPAPEVLPTPVDTSGQVLMPTLDRPRPPSLLQPTLVELFSTKSLVEIVTLPDAEKIAKLDRAGAPIVSVGAVIVGEVAGLNDRLRVIEVGTGEISDLIFRIESADGAQVRVPVGSILNTILSEDLITRRFVPLKIVIFQSMFQRQTEYERQIALYGEYQPPNVRGVPYFSIGMSDEQDIQRLVDQLGISREEAMLRVL